MSTVERLTAALLAAAARRWPADLRDERAREWSAELHVLRGQPVAALRFALSLACSPAVEDENGVVLGWRERLPGLGRVTQTVLGILVIGATAPMLGYYLTSAAADIMRHSSRVASAAAIGGVVVILVALVSLLGASLGRQLPLARPARALAGAAAMVLVWLGHLLSEAATDLSNDGTPVPHAIQLVVWVLLPGFPVLGYVVARLASGARARWTAAPLALVGAVGLLDLIAMVVGAGHVVPNQLRLLTRAPLWFPLSNFVRTDPVGPGEAGADRMLGVPTGLLDDVASTTRPLLILCGFALAFGLGIARARVPADEPQPAGASTPQTVAWVGRLGLGAVVAGSLLWATAIAFVTPAQRATLPDLGPGQWTRGDQLMWAEEMHIWLLELQLAGVLLATLGVVVHLVRRGPSVLPATLFAGALTAADVLLARHQVGGVRAFLVALVVATVSFGVATALSPVLGRPDAAVGRRALVGAAVLAAWCAPVPYWGGAMASTSDAVPSVRALTAVAGMLLIALAVAAALAARAERPSAVLVLVGVVAPVVGMTVLGVLLLRQWDYMVTVPVAAPLLALLTFAAAVHGPGRRGWRWALLGVGAVVLAVPLAYIELYMSIPLGSGVVAAAGYVNGSDSMSFLAGALVVGLPLAAFAAGRATRRVGVRQSAPASRQLEAAPLTGEPLPELG